MDLSVSVRLLGRLVTFILSQSKVPRSFMLRDVLDRSMNLLLATKSYLEIYGVVLEVQLLA